MRSFFWSFFLRHFFPIFLWKLEILRGLVCSFVLVCDWVGTEGFVCSILEELGVILRLFTQPFLKRLCKAAHLINFKNQKSGHRTLRFRFRVKSQTKSEGLWHRPLLSCCRCKTSGRHRCACGGAHAPCGIHACPSKVSPIC